MVKQAFFKTILLIIPFYLLSIAIFGQQKYWLEIKPGVNENSEAQIELIKKTLKSDFGTALKFHYQSKWSPVISISANADIIEELKRYSEIESLQLQRKLVPLNVDKAKMIEYSYALEQIKAHYLIDSMKLSGAGINIGVIDGGFMDANVEPSLKHLIENDQVKFFKDYLLQGNTDPFYGKRVSNDDHGTQVLRMIVGSDNGTSIQYGMAQNANLFLARTDHGIRERQIEEEYWVAAIELFYEMGIRLVNSSLGYTNGFDRRKENHSIKEVDGKSSMITKTAQLAAEKGMLIVSAAGNDGHTKWKVLSLPADAKDVFTVGAVRFDDWSKIYYSSIGPEKMDYVKPDVSCFAANGTSFSAPIITGLAACIWEYDSTFSNYDIMNIIRQSSHLNNNPNNYVGYGVPDSELILNILKERKIKSSKTTIKISDDEYELEIPSGIERVIIFHKKNKFDVIEQESINISSEQKTLKILRKDNADYTTLSSQDKWNIEIEWK